MIAFSNLLLAIGNILDSLLWLLTIVVFIRVILSWVRADPYSPIVRFFSATTDTLLQPIRRKIPTVYGGIDVSPLILLLIISGLRYFLVATILDYAVLMKTSAFSGR